MKRVYLGAFGSWDDIESGFQIKMKEPSRVFAVYDHDSYDGRALVIFEKKGRYFFVTGSHCSCYGLEDQWDDAPDSFTKCQFRKLVMQSEFGLMHQYRTKILEWLDS